MIIEQPETFWTLLHNGAHWKFELFLGALEIIFFDGLIGLLFWPWIKKHIQHHLDDDRNKGRN